MLVNSDERSTFDISSTPDEILPSDVVTSSPIPSNVPELSVAE